MSTVLSHQSQNDSMKGQYDFSHLSAGQAPADEQRPVVDGLESSCWPRRTATSWEVLFGWGLILFGVAIAGVAIHLTTRVPKPDSSGAIVIGVFAALSVLGGVTALVFRQFSTHFAVVTHADGIEIVYERTARKLAWNEIHKVVTMEFYPHIKADMILLVTIEPHKGSEIKIDTSFEGDPGSVIQTLLTHCDYIVRNPQGYSRHTS